MAAAILRFDIEKHPEKEGFFQVIMSASDQGGVIVGGFPNFTEASAFVQTFLRHGIQQAVSDETRRQYLGAIILGGKPEKDKM